MPSEPRSVYTTYTVGTIILYAMCVFSRLPIWPYAVLYIVYTHNNYFSYIIFNMKYTTMTGLLLLYVQLRLASLGPYMTSLLLISQVGGGNFINANRHTLLTE